MRRVVRGSRYRRRLMGMLMVIDADEHEPECKCRDCATDPWMVEEVKCFGA